MGFRPRSQGATDGRSYAQESVISSEWKAQFAKAIWVSNNLNVIPIVKLLNYSHGTKIQVPATHSQIQMRT